MRSITADLNDRGVSTVKGGRWQPVTLRQVLISARIAGLRSLDGEIVAKAVWPKIIDVRTSERLRTLLLDPERRTSRPVRRYALAGLLRCSKCGTVMVSRPRTDGTRRYVCPTGEPVGARNSVTLLTSGFFAGLDAPKLHVDLGS